MSFLIQSYQQLKAWIWDSELEALPWPRRWLTLAIRVGVTLINDCRNGDITMRAMSLVYTTLISLVPLLALAFSLLKAFGAHDTLRPALEQFLEPLGSGAEPIIDRIVDFVSNVQVGVLGAVGVVILLYSVLSLIQKIELGCNQIWRVRKLRPINHRMTGYISVLVVGPLVILAANSLTASAANNEAVDWVTSMEPFGLAFYLGGLAVPYILYSLGFTLLFKFLPNTRVQFLPALGGGIFSGVLWQTAGWSFTTFAKNAGNVNAIYSSFAILILALIWFYISWMIMFLGCRVAFLLQYRGWLTLKEFPPRLGHAERERLALLIMTRVADRFLQGQQPWTLPELSTALHVPRDNMHDVAEQLVDGGLLLPMGVPRLPLIPQQDIAHIQVARIVDVIRLGNPDAQPSPGNTSAYRLIDQLLTKRQEADHEIFADWTLRDLARHCRKHVEPAEDNVTGPAR